MFSSLLSTLNFTSSQQPHTRVSPISIESEEREDDWEFVSEFGDSDSQFLGAVLKEDDDAISDCGSVFSEITVPIKKSIRHKKNSSRDQHPILLSLKEQEAKLKKLNRIDSHTRGKRSSKTSGRY